MITERRRTRRAYPGNACVETALFLPAALLLFLGIMEAGNLFTAWLTVQKAAENGARLAATGQGLEEGNRLALILDRAGKSAASMPGGDKAQVQVRSWPTPDTSGPGLAGDPGGACLPVEVRVDLAYAPVIPLFEPLFPTQVALSGRERRINEPWEPCP